VAVKARIFVIFQFNCVTN